MESYTATIIVPLPVAEAAVLPGVPSPIPPVEAIAVPVGLVLVLLLMPVTAALLVVTKNGSDIDVPPPGAELKTLVSNVPDVASNADGITADKFDGET